MTRDRIADSACSNVACHTLNIHRDQLNYTAGVRSVNQALKLSINQIAVWHVDRVCRCAAYRVCLSLKTHGTVVSAIELP